MEDLTGGSDGGYEEFVCEAVRTTFAGTAGHICAKHSISAREEVLVSQAVHRPVMRDEWVAAGAICVDHVHELSVGPVQSVRGPHAVEERPAGVEAGDSAESPLSKVAHIACSLSSQGTAQHMDVVVADLHLLHQPPDKLRRGVAHQLGVLTCRVVPGGQRQPLPVHCQDVEVPRLEVLPAESLRAE